MQAWLVWGWAWGQEAITERTSVAALGYSRNLQLSKGNFAALDLPGNEVLGCAVTALSALSNIQI